MKRLSSYVLPTRTNYDKSASRTFSRSMGTALLVSVLTSCGLMLERVDNIYPTYQAAVDAGALHGNSFIPSFTPKSATEIHDVHDADVNTGHGTFRFDPNDAEDFRKALEGNETSPSENEEQPAASERTYFVDDFLVYVDWAKGECRYWLRLSR